MTLPALTLRNKLLVFAALIVLVPGAFVGVVAERSGRDSLQRVIGGRLAREAHHTAGRLSSALQAERETLTSLARQEVMREVRVGDIDKRISQSLVTLREGNEVRVDYLVLDVVGRVVAASRPELIGAPPAWAKRAQPGPTPRREGLVLATRVPDPDTPGAELGRLVGLLDWRILATVTERVRRDLDAQGIVAQVLVAAADGSVMGAGRFERASPDTPWSEIVASAQGGGSYVVNDALGLIVGSALLSDDLPDWTMLVAEPLSNAFAPARDLRNRIALLVALALASALAIAALAARRVTRPLTDLTDAIKGLSRGDPAVLRVPVRSQDEVGTLAAAFNHMASELDRVQRNLVEAEKFAFVGELASGVAHEVRTSLGVLRSSAQILQRSIPPDSGSNSAELAEMIRAEADRLGGVVDDLLSLDRPQLHRDAQPVSRSVFRAAAFVEPQATERGIRVHCSPAEGEANVLCDSEAIYQVTVNLLVNAIEALSEGGSIEVEILAAHEGYGGFVVRDDGSGIPEALRERIFQPFVTARDGGVGLGLTFVKRVVHEHQGRILLEPGARGACFRVELPIAGEQP